MFEIIEPFRVRIPLPIRQKVGPMELDTVTVDGSTVRVTYHKAPQSFGWWCARATHEFEWLPEIRTPDDAAKHYAHWLVEQHEQPLSDAQRDQLQTGAEVLPAGRGQAVLLSADLAGLFIPGDKHYVYVISVGGTSGALRVPSSAYHWYPVERFEVLDEITG